MPVTHVTHLTQTENNKQLNKNTNSLSESLEIRLTPVFSFSTERWRLSIFLHSCRSLHRCDFIQLIVQSAPPALSSSSHLSHHCLSFMSCSLSLLTFHHLHLNLYQSLFPKEINPFKMHRLISLTSGPPLYYWVFIVVVMVVVHTAAA